MHVTLGPDSKGIKCLKTFSYIRFQSILQVLHLTDPGTFLLYLNSNYAYTILQIYYQASACLYLLALHTYYILYTISSGTVALMFFFVPITTKVVSSNSVHGKMYSIQLYVIKFSLTCDRSVAFSGYSGFLHQ